MIARFNYDSPTYDSLSWYCSWYGRSLLMAHPLLKKAWFTYDTPTYHGMLDNYLWYAHSVYCSWLCWQFLAILPEFQQFRTSNCRYIGQTSCLPIKKCTVTLLDVIRGSKTTIRKLSCHLVVCLSTVVASTSLPQQQQQQQQQLPLLCLG